MITWADFEAIDFRAGTIVRVEDFPEARKPAYKLWIDFGPELGIKRSSAQITSFYTKDELTGRQILAVVNFLPKQIAGFVSEVLVTGFVSDGSGVVLVQSERRVPNGTRLA